MQTDLSIHVDPATLHMSDYGTILGGIWVSVGSTTVPERGWSDSPVVIQGWWIKESLAVAESVASVAEWDFMDGPYTLRLCQIQPSLWEITARERCLKGVRDTGIGVVDSAQVLRELCRSARETLTECHARRWRTPDTASLARALRAIARFIRG